MENMNNNIPSYRVCKREAVKVIRLNLFLECIEEVRGVHDMVVINDIRQQSRKILLRACCLLKGIGHDSKIIIVRTVDKDTVAVLCSHLCQTFRHLSRLEW